MADKGRGPLQRIHADETLESGESKYSLRYWRSRETKEIVESLRPGLDESLKVTSEGRIINGNVCVKILEERGFDVDSLDRELV
jgi:hypothetical protein